MNLVLIIKSGDGIMRLILWPPGAGKGHSCIHSCKYDIPHISTEHVRDNIKQGTELGKARLYG